MIVGCSASKCNIIEKVRHFGKKTHWSDIV
nr:MAG TPA: hypothetical protein [Caudoviricetes sp.]